MAVIQDWCISRQLWWGHRCPAYIVKIDGATPDVRMQFIGPIEVSNGEIAL